METQVTQWGFFGFQMIHKPVPTSQNKIGVYWLSYSRCPWSPSFRPNRTWGSPLELSEHCASFLPFSFSRLCSPPCWHAFSQWRPRGPPTALGLYCPDSQSPQRRAVCLQMASAQLLVWLFESQWPGPGDQSISEPIVVWRE